MKLTLKERTKVFLTGEYPDHRTAFLSGADMPGDVNSETAMKYSAVNACVRVLAETFASAPIVLYKRTKDGREPVTDDPLYDVLHNRPNEEMAPFNFNETMMTNFCAGGNAVCEKLVNSKGELLGLYPYNHSITQIDRDPETKRLRYRIGNGNNTKTLKRSEVLHVPNLSFDGVMGLSPISYAAETILLGLSYEKFGVEFYKNAAMPSGAFESEKGIGDIAYERLKKGIKENYTGLRNSGTPLLLEEGLKWHQITINPIDAQLLESKYFQIEDICRIYRVPQHLVNKLDRSTNNNIEHQSLEFVMYTMLPNYKRFEDNINMQILAPEKRKNGLYFEYKLDGLLRGDQKSRAEAYGMGRQWGWLPVNDIRKLENLPGIGPTGDRYLEPANMIEAGKTEAAVSNYSRLVEDIYKMIEERR